METFDLAMFAGVLLGTVSIAGINALTIHFMDDPEFPSGDHLIITREQLNRFLARAQWMERRGTPVMS